ncbi:hypothetical protein N5079_00430 [Planotetraspora sp. A-T 1434]|uniref:hypothetical protein n=1 Tax=Planotetraspora sp. A-T 1434 TaxID=2979219 RepID=UPI0021C1A004|nr:hypothetical protein [Planotetraspora sp. A-T 1434]MCT9928676.1 hypothetical protein [Planotetraspora sp. A-T 1434]
MTGYIDESIRAGGLYFVGIVIADCLLSDEVQTRLRKLVPSTSPPHWYDESADVRQALISEVARLDIMALVYGCRFDRPKRKEAARARALTWMVHNVPKDVRHLVLGQREASQDLHDRKVLRGLGGRPPRYTVTHAAMAKEPLLWVADIVVSSVAGALVSNDASVLLRLEGVLAAAECEP